jgi:hypothetical protein
MDTTLAISPEAQALITAIIKWGVLVFALIQGVKDMFADYFAAHPMIARICNAALALFGGLGLCLITGGKIDLMCVVKAIGIFIVAAGIHQTVSGVAKVAGGDRSAKI